MDDSTLPRALELVKANNQVGEALDQCRQHGLRHGRFAIIHSDDGRTNAYYLRVLDALELAGCRVVAVVEFPMNTVGGPIVFSAITFRCPESLFTGEVPL